MFIDVKKAHLSGKVQEGEHAFVRRPDGKILQPKSWLHGVRPAAHDWEEECLSKFSTVAELDGKQKRVHWLSMRGAWR